MDWFIFLLIAGAFYLLALAGYRLWLAAKGLFTQLTEVKSKISSFAPNEIEVTPASPVFAEDLPRLLRERCAMEKRKAREREERKRRLVARISSINIDRR
jgi:hypothetical protein